MKFTLEFWLEDPSGKKSKRILVAEHTWDADEYLADEMAEEAGTMIEEAVECNV